MRRTVPLWQAGAFALALAGFASIFTYPAAYWRGEQEGVVVTQVAWEMAAAKICQGVR
jgi:uncharacterized membrane protein